MPDHDDPGSGMGRAIAEAEDRRAVADGHVHSHPYDGVTHDDCPRCQSVGVEHPQAGDKAVESALDGVKGALARLTQPDRVAERVGAARSRGVGALLPPLGPLGVEALGEVPDDYRPGGTRPGTGDRFIDGFGMQRLRAEWDADTPRREAFERVVEYVVAIDAFYGDEEPPEVVDTADGSPESPALLLADLRLLVGLTEED